MKHLAILAGLAFLAGSGCGTPAAHVPPPPYFAGLVVEGEVATVAGLLELVRTQGGRGNFLVLASADGPYVQFAAERGGPGFVIEAVGNDYLEGAVSSEADRALRAAGWEKPDGENYRRRVVVSNAQDLEALATLGLDTLSVAYGWRRGARLGAQVCLE